MTADTDLTAGEWRALALVLAGAFVSGAVIVAAIWLALAWWGPGADPAPAPEPGASSTDPCSDFWVGHALGSVAQEAAAQVRAWGPDGPVPDVWEVRRSPVESGCLIYGQAGLPGADWALDMMIGVCIRDGRIGQAWLPAAWDDPTALATLNAECGATVGPPSRAAI